MSFQANTRVAILRGTTTTALGDEADDNSAGAVVPALADMHASLIERGRSVYDPASGTRRTVRVITCRVPVSTPHPDTGEPTPVAILEGDRVRDNRTGRIYAFTEGVSVPRSLAGQSSLTLDLKDTAAVSLASV